MTFGEKISHLRKANGMTQEDLGKILNVTYQAVSKWERGESLPDFNTMSQIAKLFKVPLSYFEEGSENVEEATNEQQAQQEQQPVAAPPTNTINYIGTCVACGKLLKEGEEYTTDPKVVCRPCAVRLIENQKRKKEEAAKQQAYEKEKARQEQIAAARKQAYIREKARREQLGSGFDKKLVIAIIVAAIFYIVLMAAMLSFKGEDNDTLLGGGIFVMFLPSAIFAIVLAIREFFEKLKDDALYEFEGYTLKLSLIVGSVFAAINIILFLVFYLAVERNTMFIVMLFVGALLSFTFVSQYMWGSCIKSVFTCGGFTFKMPFVIFTLSIDSCLMMILIKVLLGILSIAIFILTSIFFGLVAMVGSAFTFIPCLASKTARDRKA